MPRPGSKVITVEDSVSEANILHSTLEKPMCADTIMKGEHGRAKLHFSFECQSRFEKFTEPARHSSLAKAVPKHNLPTSWDGPKSVSYLPLRHAELFMKAKENPRPPFNRLPHVGKKPVKDHNESLGQPLDLRTLRSSEHDRIKEDQSDEIDYFYASVGKSGKAPHSLERQRVKPKPTRVLNYLAREKLCTRDMSELVPQEMRQTGITEHDSAFVNGLRQDQGPLSYKVSLLPPMMQRQDWMVRSQSSASSQMRGILVSHATPLVPMTV